MKGISVFIPAEHIKELEKLGVSIRTLVPAGVKERLGNLSLGRTYVFFNGKKAREAFELEFYKTLADLACKKLKQNRIDAQEKLATDKAA